MKKIETTQAPAAIGPYSQGIVVEPRKLLYTAGQIPLDPGTGQMVAGNIETQTRQVLENLKAILEAAGTNLENVIKTTVFLADMNDFAAMNAIYSQYFGPKAPARSAVQVARLPRDARIEIEAIAQIE